MSKIVPICRSNGHGGCQFKIRGIHCYFTCSIMVDEDNQMADATQVEHKLFEEISEMRKRKTTKQENCNEKGSDAGQKAKKKQVDEEISKFSTKLKERHAEELASLDYTSNSVGN
ncbi:Uncharacterized protein Adt_09811 [Abeliophyllum distichum]|uniref:Uncharacterized protein n=1 Tax=Abeliophyllum distichum TaxID=126358 RepID=A0ABD1UI91_9LAMI